MEHTTKLWYNIDNSKIHGVYVMSKQNQEETVVGPQLEFIDIINATKIMEAAIERGVFKVKELAEVAPIVARFQDFSSAILAEQEDRQDQADVDASTDEQGE
jgi:predicted NAD/FAD-binding protein